MAVLDDTSGGGPIVCPNLRPAVEYRRPRPETPHVAAAARQTTAACRLAGLQPLSHPRRPDADGRHRLPPPRPPRRRAGRAQPRRRGETAPAPDQAGALVGVTATTPGRLGEVVRHLAVPAAVGQAGP